MKNALIILIIMIVGLIGLYQVNKQVGIVDLSRIHVETDDQLSSSKVKIQKGGYSINRTNDQEMFDKNQGARVVFDGNQVALLETGYGENDFLITYDDRYYFQFRHWKFNHRNQHTYDFYLYRNGDHINVKAEIEGPNGMSFDEPMNLISMAGQLRCNAPIDSTRTVYNMIGLEKPNH